MDRPATRALAVLALLQTHRSLSGAELAARLEIDRRTVRRYITLLQDLGLPIEGKPGRHGGYHLGAGFKLPPLLFSDGEALAITVGLLAVRQFRLAGTAAEVEGALAKVDRVLPAALREQVQAVAKHLVLAPAPAGGRPAGREVLTPSRAVERCQRVQIRYCARSGEETVRALDPYGVVCESGRWYAVGRCHLREATRMFRVDRILGIELLPDTFTRPAELDCARHVARALATVPYAWPVEVLLETTLADAEQRVPAGVALLEPTAAGVRFVSRVESLDWVARLLIGLECPFLVIEPPELRDALRRVARQVAALADRRPAID